MTTTPRPQINIDPSERLIAIGRTGAGKTEWVKAMLRVAAKSYPVVIIDPKADWLGQFPAWETKKKQPGTVDKPHLTRVFNPKFHVQVMQLNMTDHAEALSKACEDILAWGRRTRRGIMVYFDECTNIATSTRIPPGVSALWTMGRSLNVGAWIGNQRSLRIPEIFKSQAESFVVFDLPGPRDRKDVAEYTHTPAIEEMEEVPLYHYWYFHRKAMRHAVLMPPLDLGERVQSERVSKH